MWSTVISQYADSPIITTLISNWLQYIDQTVDIDAFFDNIWNINTAQGYGLDVWGRIVGVTRTLTISTVRFFGVEEQGFTVDPFGQSPFFAGTPATANFNLSDSAFRTLIFAKALANITNGSIPSINQILLNLFPNRGNAFVTEPFPTTNFILQSNTFNNAPWTNTNCTVTPNSGTSPDGTNDAWLWQRSAFSGVFSGEDRAAVKTPTLQTWTYSIYARPGTGNFLALYMSDNDGNNNIQVTFNVATGIVSAPPIISNSGSSNFSNAKASITPAANGFFRCALTFLSTTSTMLRPYYNGNQNNSYLLGSDSFSTTTILVFGAQLESSDNAGPYVPTTTVPVTLNSGPNMTMTYTFNFQLTSVENAIVSNSGVLPRPVGVSASVVQI